MVPARAVGGDFYDFHPQRDGRLGIVAGDVSDKGMAAALFMSLSTSLIRAEAVRFSSTVRALLTVNKLLIEMDVSSMFVTVFYGVLDFETRELHYVRAGHPPPVVLDGQCRVLDIPFKAGQPLGIFDRPLLDEQSIPVPPGGTVLIYSDGLTEAADSQGKEFGLERALEVIRAHPEASAQDICDRLWECLLEYTHPSPQQDDVTLLCLKNVEP
jgi:sigma-B regulation protein RsbU (phosphoserine phosphatase)